MPSVRLRRALALLLSVTLLSLALACGDDDDDLAEDEEEDAPVAAAYKPSGNEGTIAGVVNLNGTAPERRAISMDADNACAANNPTNTPGTAVSRVPGSWAGTPVVGSIGTPTSRSRATFGAKPVMT